MKVGKLDIAVFLILTIIIVFVGGPVLASAGPLVWIEEKTQPEIVDPNESFDQIKDVNGSALVGDFRTEDTYQTLYTRSIESCNTYTLKGGLELAIEDNGMATTGASTELNTNEPTAITCVVSAENLEGNEDKEFLVMLLDFDSQNGGYIKVGSIEELRDRQSGGIGTIFDIF